MKKISYLFVLCMLFAASYAAPAPMLNHSLAIASEPEPHPYNIVLKFKVKNHVGTPLTVYLQWVVTPETTIDELREVVSAWSKDPDVVMTWNGIRLQDGFTLAEYGIGPGEIISCS
jgi:hypothetical protein